MKTSTAGDVLPGGAIVGYMRWIGATQGSVLSVSSDGVEILYSRADYNDFIDVHPLFQSVRNLTVDQMGSGVLYLYFL
jgi:hypothetical protein